MPTYTAYTTLPGKAPAEELGAALETLTPVPTGVGVFEIEDGSGLWEVGAYFIEAPDETALALLAAAFDAKPFSVSELPETDWVAKVKRELAPVTAGRFFLYGSHDADKVLPDAVPLLIEAAMAFGTGHHGTTQGCLRAFDALLSAGQAQGPVLDVGCGTAVLAMAAARVFDTTVVASDIDPVAVDVAEANLAANGMAGQVICVEATGLDHPEIAGAGPFGVIFANILKGPLIDLAPAITAALAPQGHVILSGLLNEQASEVINAYADAGLSLVARDEIGEWTTLTLKMP
ncbi:ribosomal L11 methyltransferase [Dinoroseobacter shibae DFL 12 = DSM 16493]|jgi:ribosomal protein L11 methyltransferase|uniref:Ribosomal protein L11 methyltransferase n=1 Tax=Dinoroseobacter shibae (strain DSM 16493 / NCIMB 14021 / DFL 12) TaxID=398580 RepID=A8LHP5_DINSH|nr:50S ribosomal protein L11 methyltransferase [Dinoroseobacter shibae]ABV92842.1 ribosomal L11 methyltransferase [Dinoroseobacter shibae DFL 12 = DSM 16493]URF47781.1 50S ribosomal protein L11 methyltransferase [Dinoroseobacter shibae]URF52091.1 50S ribosomal protein L11 methyltransferase [Dinoroseobacter shibae]